ncbi:hypothetical protein MMC25_000091 [Agyrium rufum]|nr:hypothetical protein [Agyrium rufum]
MPPPLSRQPSTEERVSSFLTRNSSQKSRQRPKISHPHPYYDVGSIGPQYVSLAQEREAQSSVQKANKGGTVKQLINTVMGFLQNDADVLWAYFEGVRHRRKMKKAQAWKEAQAREIDQHVYQQLAEQNRLEKERLRKEDEMEHKRISQRFSGNDSATTLLDTFIQLNNNESKAVIKGINEARRSRDNSTPVSEQAQRYEDAYRAERDAAPGPSHQSLKAKQQSRGGSEPRRDQPIQTTVLKDSYKGGRNTQDEAKFEQMLSQDSRANYHYEPIKRKALHTAAKAAEQHHSHNFSIHSGNTRFSQAESTGSGPPISPKTKVNTKVCKGCYSDFTPGENNANFCDTCLSRVTFFGNKAEPLPPAADDFSAMRNAYEGKQAREDAEEARRYSIRRPVSPVSVAPPTPPPKDNPHVNYFQRESKNTSSSTWKQQPQQQSINYGDHFPPADAPLPLHPALRTGTRRPVSSHYGPVPPTPKISSKPAFVSSRPFVPTIRSASPPPVGLGISFSPATPSAFFDLDAPESRPVSDLLTSPYTAADDATSTHSDDVTSHSDIDVQAAIPLPPVFASEATLSRDDYRDAYMSTRKHNQRVRAELKKQDGAAAATTNKSKGKGAYDLRHRTSALNSPAAAKYRREQLAREADSGTIAERRARKRTESDARRASGSGTATAGPAPLQDIGGDDSLLPALAYLPYAARHRLQQAPAPLRTRSPLFPPGASASVARRPDSEIVTHHQHREDGSTRDKAATRARSDSFYRPWDDLIASEIGKHEEKVEEMVRTGLGNVDEGGMF